MRIVDVETRDQLEDAWAIRLEVFVEEQEVPPEEEVDALDTDPTTFHSVAYDESAAGGEWPVATGRVLGDPAHPGEAHIGRLAVRKDWRGTGLGALMMAHLEGVAAAQYGAADGADLVVRVELSAQEYAMGFYRRLGYEAVTGERYLDAGIWHQDMARTVRL